jgi:hypothetical protein
MGIASLTPRSEPHENSTVHGLGEVSRARHIVDALGGRFSLELGIEVDRDRREIERWALAATLIGDRTSLSTSLNAYRALARAGIETPADVEACDPEELVRALDEGHLRCDRGTPARLIALARAVRDRHPEGLAPLGAKIEDPIELERELCALPGWDRTIARTFLRELRGVWRGAEVQLDPRSAVGARHVAIPSHLDELSALAAAAHLDVRDLEAGLARLALTHDTSHCPGGEECPLAEADREQFVHF